MMTTNRVQILLVEDSAADVLLMREAMREGGVPKDLHVVGDGEQALVFLRDGLPGQASVPVDLVLLDLNLPRKRGLDVLAEIRADPALRRTPVIILTTSTAESDVRRAYDTGANCFMVKPVDFDRFRRVVAALDEFWFGVARLPAPDRTPATVAEGREG